MGCATVSLKTRAWEQRLSTLPLAFCSRCDVEQLKKKKENVSVCVCDFFFLTPLLKYSFAYTQISTGRDKGEEKQKERKARARLTKETSFIFFFYCYYSKSDDYNRRIEEDYLSVFFFPPFFSLEPLRWQKPLFFFSFALL